MRANLNEADPRSDPRSHVFLMAVLATGATSHPVRVRNLSAQGALLEGGDLPPENATVSLKRGSLTAAGKVAWARGRHCGIRFIGPIAVAEWVDRAGVVGQQRIDAAVAEFRNGGSDGSELAFLSGGANHDSLKQMSADLLQICERIAALPNLSVGLGEELLKIEATAHALREVGCPAGCCP